MILKLIKKLSPIVTDLFLRGRHLGKRKNPTFHLFFLSQSYFKVAKSIRLNAAHYAAHLL